MRKLTALVSGLLFGNGLILSDMVNPARVRAFLDFFGDWDPSLTFVMIGAISVAAVAWLIVGKRETSLLGSELPAKPSTTIDRRLIVGSAAFGFGWGLTGMCTAPGLTTLGLGRWEVLVFFAAMVAGMYLYHRWNDLHLLRRDKLTRT